MVTEESIGDLIQQPWCTVEVATAVPRQGCTYAITWRTYLQSSFTEGNQTVPSNHERSGSHQVVQRRCGNRHRVET